MRLSVRFGMAALAAALLLGAAQDTRADFFPSLVSVNPNGSNFDYTYSATFDPPVGYTLRTGNWPPPVTGGTPVGNLPFADFLTIYDIQGLVPGSLVNLNVANFEVYTQGQGYNGPNQAPTDTSLPNITIRYIGPNPLATFTEFGPVFRFTSSIGVTQIGDYSSQETRLTRTNLLVKEGNSSAVLVPAAIPEPSSMALVGMGIAGLFGYGYRRRRQG